MFFQNFGFDFQRIIQLYIPGDKSIQKNPYYTVFSGSFIPSHLDPHILPCVIFKQIHSLWPCIKLEDQFFHTHTSERIKLKLRRLYKADVRAWNKHVDDILPVTYFSYLIWLAIVRTTNWSHVFSPPACLCLKNSEVS
jgi:hypothetical protein